jgi:hypothetical protein
LIHAVFRADLTATTFALNPEVLVAKYRMVEPVIFNPLGISIGPLVVSGVTVCIPQVSLPNTPVPATPDVAADWGIDVQVETGASIATSPPNMTLLETPEAEPMVVVSPADVVNA